MIWSDIQKDIEEILVRLRGVESISVILGKHEWEDEEQIFRIAEINRQIYNTHPRMPWSATNQDNYWRTYSLLDILSNSETIVLGGIEVEDIYLYLSLFIHLLKEEGYKVYLLDHAFSGNPKNFFAVNYNINKTILFIKDDMVPAGNRGDTPARIVDMLIWEYMNAYDLDEKKDEDQINEVWDYYYDELEEV